MMMELYAEVGKEAMMNLIDVFGGTTLAIPTREQVNAAIKSIRVYLCAKESPVDHWHLTKVGQEFGLTALEVSEIHSRVHRELEEFSNKYSSLLKKERSENYKEELDLLNGLNLPHAKTHTDIS